MRTVTTNIFDFSELSTDAKKKAIDNVKADENYLHDEWYSHTKEDFHTILDLIGFYNIESQFSYSCSQGDGACFTGDYKYQKGMLKSIKDYAPKDTELHEIVKAIQDFMKGYAYKLSCRIHQYGSMYCHSNTMSFNWEMDNSYCFDFKTEDDEDAIGDLFKSLADWYHNRIVAEYDSLFEDEYVIESIPNLNYEFTADGEIV